MNNIEIAVSLGYTINMNGELFLNNEYKECKIHNEKYKIFYFSYNKKKYSVYLSQLQAYNKFKEESFNDRIIYLNKNSLDCSFDNISLQKIETENRLNCKTKICTCCKRELLVEDFVFKNKSTGLRAPRCKECDRYDKRKSYKKYFKQNRKLFLDRNKRFTKSRYKILNEWKSCGCIICGESDTACLDFHHISEKNFEISNKITSISIKELEEEKDKCIVLCSNCHRKLHKYKLSIEELKEYVNNNSNKKII